MFIGKIGEEVETPIKIVKRIERKSWKKSFKCLYILRDPSGAILTATMPNVGINVGDDLILQGRITRHTHFHGAEQTHIKWTSILFPRKNPDNG